MMLKILLIAQLVRVGQQSYSNWLNVESPEAAKVSQYVWSGLCRTGKWQSPIKLDSQSSSLGLATLNYHNTTAEQSNLQLLYNGYSVILYNFTHSILLVNGIDFREHVYAVEQIHFHCGTEHVVDNMRYDMEVQIVHRSILFADFNEAMANERGLAILSILYKVSEVPNRALTSIQRCIEEAPRVKNQSAVHLTKLDEFFIFDDLYDQIGDYFQYRGSLTVPNCRENVFWIVLAQPRTITADQLNVFCNPGNEANPAQRHTNYRDLQPSNNRLVFFLVENGVGKTAIAAWKLMTLLLLQTVLVYLNK